MSLILNTKTSSVQNYRYVHDLAS